MRQVVALPFLLAALAPAFSHNENLHLLAASGFYDGGVRAGAELVANESVTTCEMNPADYPVAIEGSVATVVDGGSALFCGGGNGQVVTASCYEYDFGSGTWSDSGAHMAEARQFPYAVQMPGSGWLVTGGFDGNELLRSSEVLTVHILEYLFLKADV